MTSRQAIQSPTADSEWPKQPDYTTALQNPDHALIGDLVKKRRVVKTRKRSAYDVVRVLRRSVQVGRKR